MRRLFAVAESEQYDDQLSRCVICGKPGVIKSEHRSLCAKHYVALEDRGCLEASIVKEFNLDGQSATFDEIKHELKKQRPDLFRRLENFH